MSLFVKNLKYLMRKSGLVLQADLVRAMKQKMPEEMRVPQGTISRLLKQEHKHPDEETVIKFASLFDVSPSDLRYADLSLNKMEVLNISDERKSFEDGLFYLQKNINFLLESNGLNPNKLADKMRQSLPVEMRLPQNTIQRLKDGTSSVRDETLEKFASFFSVSLKDLRYRNLSKSSVELVELIKENEILIPRYNDIRASMGDGLVIENARIDEVSMIKVNKQWAQENIKGTSSLNNLCLITGYGHSMQGMFEHGDLILIDTGVKEVRFDGAYFFRIGNEGFIKNLQRIPNQGIEASSTNAQFRPWLITADMDFEVLARVVKVWRSFNY